MNGKLQEWLHDLGVALGLIERPKLQPVPVRHDDERRRQRRR
ncbi:PA1414 family protein [Pseudomonas sp. DTU_2021_1001937_2_SI_NGA_ILE_001]|nr:PA1414 family protein [Pseudomonas sp. DTU_2021_1001937_2_SI_NGA_ILE_001]WNW11411.1 PA1414 family protein [Pseudomonas sp. DTU_2021_1001937_2_SI_NGA_ILE_001]